LANGTFAQNRLLARLEQLVTRGSAKQSCGHDLGFVAVVCSSKTAHMTLHNLCQILLLDIFVLQRKYSSRHCC